MLTGSGPLTAGSLGAVALSNGLATSTAWFVFSPVLLDAPFKGGVMVPKPDLFFPVPIDAFGGANLPFTWPLGLPSRVSVFMQFWVEDASGPVGFSASNGLAAVTP